MIDRLGALNHVGFFAFCEEDVENENDCTNRECLSVVQGPFLENGNPGSALPAGKSNPRNRRITKKEPLMPQGDKSSYTDKQKRQAEHIEAGYEAKGLSTKTAEARAWATVNKLTGGGKKSGSGRKKSGSV